MPIPIELALLTVVPADASLLTAFVSAAQTATDPFSQLLGGGLAEDDPSFLRGFDRLTDAATLVRVALDLVVALVLAATIAFHPRRHGRAVSQREVEYPKTVLLFAVVGTMVAEIVVISPAMALVVFGIGGLLRFRTDVGTAHETGHVILATLVGIACGLGRYPLAVIATAVGWLLIWSLERGHFYRLVVDGVDRRSIERSLPLYRELLEADGWLIRGVERNPGKNRFSVYVRGNRHPGEEPVEDRLETTEPGLRGEPFWEEL